MVLLLVLLLVAILINLSQGSVSIPLAEIFDVLTGGQASQESWTHIIRDYRLPKTISAILMGSALSVSGLLMQTIFRNPLAGPFVLGISSGAALGAALLIMGSSLFAGIGTMVAVNDVALALAASAGSFLVLLAVVVVAARIRDTMALLIIGLMFGSLTAAVVTVLSYFTSASQLQQFIFWSFGSVGNLGWGEIIILTFCVVTGLLLSIFAIKPLNALLLGEQYARSLGVNLKNWRLLIIIATGILAGGVTAFAGPIAFIGLAVPHLCRLLLNTTNHKLLLPAVVLLGAALLLFCDTVAQLPGSSYVLPLNAITSIIGAPIVIWLLLRKRNMVF